VLFEKLAALADVAVTFSNWFTDDFRCPRGFGDDGIGIATAFLKSHVEKHLAKNREFSFAPHCVLY
jgi:hypothetical protein